VVQLARFRHILAVRQCKLGETGRGDQFRQAVRDPVGVDRVEKLGRIPARRDVSLSIAGCARKRRPARDGAQQRRTCDGRTAGPLAGFRVAHEDNAHAAPAGRTRRISLIRRMIMPALSDDLDHTDFGFAQRHCGSILLDWNRCTSLEEASRHQEESKVRIPGIGADGVRLRAIARRAPRGSSRSAHCASIADHRSTERAPESPRHRDVHVPGRDQNVQTL